MELIIEADSQAEDEGGGVPLGDAVRRRELVGDLERAAESVLDTEADPEEEKQKVSVTDAVKEALGEPDVEEVRHLVAEDDTENEGEGEADLDPLLEAL